MAGRSINRVFWGLLIGSFAFALVFSAIAVWITSKPFLADTQKQAIMSQAKREAARVDAMLDPSVSLTAFLATEPSLVSFVMGDQARDDAFVDRLSNTILPQEVTEFFVFDFEGQPISFHIVSPQAQSMELAASAADLAAFVLSTGEPTVRTIDSYRAVQSGTQELLIAAPIRNRGFAEGVLVTVVFIPFETDTISDGTSSMYARIVDPSSNWALVSAGQGAINVPIEATGLILSVKSEASLFRQIGQALVIQTILSIAAALLLPFAVFGWLGKQSILLPHAEMEMSRNKLREQQKELKELAAIAERAGEAILITDLDCRIMWHNPAFENISGYTSEEIRGQLPSKLLQGPNTSAEARAQIRAALQAFEPITIEVLNYRHGTEEYWIQLSISTMFDDEGQPYGYMAISQDVSDRKRDEANLLATTSAMEWQALHDELTGLPNRRYFNTTFDEICANPDKTRALAIVRIDLDHFKNVNDTMGHEAGDLVLCEVARILREEIGPDDVPVRVGGDEFIVFMTVDGTLQKAQILATALLKRIAEPIEYEGKSLRYGASFGIASSSCKLVAHSELVRAADAALYIAKERGRNQVVCYGTEEHQQVNEVRATAELIRVGLDRGEFEPFFQPQFDAKTRRIVGAEVLARWIHPQKGVVLPSEFLQVAQQLSMLTILDKIVMEKALRHVAELEDLGLTLPRVSFNVTADRLCDPELLIAVDARPFRHTKMSFEILESVFLDDQPEYLDFNLDRLRDKGLSIEIDDFGSGHASMISLMRVRPDVLKIDQRLVFGAPHSRVCRNMVRSIIGIADSLDIGVTAEGVETQEHADMMQEMGCETLQGFYFSEPMRFEDLCVFLSAERQKHMQIAQ
ncbi:EAL domain-containing protein [uncultured Roseobacter sp.]|uniref:bifunctional diguanylate cyclase/phosphodiesterase n=1 Tax=uncultured Roseobacter sp. TaxID=114847 RepID=UPI00260C57FB|nr:EAL domain-containing protein [uncultured Roseobacter sp.]